MVVDDDNGYVGDPALSYVSDDDDDNDKNSDIFIMMKCVFVCVFVTKNHHFLLGVSCNHP